MRRAALLVLVVPALAALACSKKARDERTVIDNHVGARDGGVVATASPSPSASSKPPDTTPLEACKGDRAPGNGNPSSGGDCKTDADCTAAKNGRCQHSPGGGPRMPWNSCSYDYCFADADCPAGNLCVCNRQGGNVCNPSNCRTDADCGGAQCGFAPNVKCWGSGGNFCRTAKDRCKDDADCPQPTGGGRSSCTFDQDTQAWGCKLDEVCPVG